MAQRKVLILATNVAKYASGRPTGLWLGELVHFYNIVAEAGFAQDVATPRGGPVPLDPASTNFLTLDKETRAFQADHGLMRVLQNTPAATEIEPEAYAGVYFTGGHGTMYDFAEDAKLALLTRAFYEQGKVVSAVCHGVCALLPVELGNGQPLIAGKELTGYSWREEVLANRRKEVPFKLETELRERGARYTRARLPFVPFAVCDGRLVTGQNPQSARAVAKTFLATLRQQSGGNTLADRA